MKKIAFITDFDGTVTAQDFYKQLLYRYEHNKLFTRYQNFIKKEINCLDFLSEVFSEVNIEEEQMQEEIKRIPIDPYFYKTVKILQKNKIDVIIISAGTKYYIKKAIDKETKNIEIIAMEGIYKNRGIELIKDENDEYYSKETGIDKKIAVRKLKNKYKKIIYAGDSIPDYGAALEADIVFAKDKLAKLLDDDKIEYIKFIDYKDILKNIINLKEVEIE